MIASAMKRFSINHAKTIKFMRLNDASGKSFINLARFFDIRSAISPRFVSDLLFAQKIWCVVLAFYLMPKSAIPHQVHFIFNIHLNGMIDTYLFLRPRKGQSMMYIIMIYFRNFLVR